MRRRLPCVRGVVLNDGCVMSTAWVHDLDPYAIELWEGGPIRWYGLAYLAGFLVGFVLIRRVLRVGVSPLPPKSASELVFALALGAVVGGRGGYIVFYQPSLLWTFSDELPFWNALAVNQGGMASHGGMIGVLVASAIFARRRSVPFLHVLDLAAFAAPVGLFFGRIANFVNGELFGRPTAETLPWAVKFPQEMYAWRGDELSAVRARLAPLHAETSSIDGIVAAIQRGDDAIAAAVAPLLTSRHPSQLYEALLEGSLVFVALAALWRRPRKPGSIASAFAMIYAGVRIFGEQFRVPDAPLTSLGLVALTRGQALSVALLLGGVIVTVVSLRAKRPPAGGWSKIGASA